jgi:hypothetical protein
MEHFLRLARRGKPKNQCRHRCLRRGSGKTHHNQSSTMNAGQKYHGIIEASEHN